MTKYKKPLLFALCLLPIAIMAGIFAGFYQLDIYSKDIIAEAEQIDPTIYKVSD